MKLRTFLISFLLFLVMFYASLSFLSIYFLESQIEMARERGLGEHYLLSSTFSERINEQTEKLTDLDKAGALFRYYERYYEDKDIYLELTDDGDVMYSTIPNAISVKETLINNSNRKISLVKDGKKEYISVVGKIDVKDSEYYLSYVYNITDVIREWRNLKNIMIILSAVFSVIFGVSLWFLLNKIFKPLNQLTVVSKKIAEGDYRDRIEVMGNDELAQLGTSFNQMAEEIEQKITKLAIEVEKNQQFVDNFSHEIRTPLTSLYGYAEYLLMASVDEEERIESLSYMMQESRHVLNMAEHLLQLSSLKQDTITMIEVPVEELFSAVSETFAIKMEENHIDLSYDYNTQYLYGDGVLLRSLLVNLTENARKACKSGGYIHWNVYKEDKKVFLEVEDNGKGMMEKDLEQITTPFYQAGKSTNRTKTGYGLGLALCQQIVKCHHGTMNFASTLGVGTRVTIIFSIS